MFARTWYRSAAVAVCLAVVCTAGVPAAEKFDNSLDFLPGDAAFYSSMLRNRQQFDLVAKSRAWHKLKTLPAVQMAWPLLQIQLQQPGSPLAEYEEWVKQPENRQLLELGVEMVSQEMFVYGDAAFARYLDRLSDLASTATEQTDGDDEARAKLAEELAELTKVPALVAGFRLGGPDAARAQIARLETVAREALKSIEPPLDDRLKRRQIGAAEWLTFELDASLVAWDDVDLPGIDKQSPSGQKLLEALRTAKFVAAIGVWNNYLLVSLGSSTDHLARLGQGPLLSENPQLKPLLAARTAPLTGISYLSREAQEVLAMRAKDLDEMVDSIKEALEQMEADPVEGIAERLDKDLQDLADDLKQYLPKPGALLSFSMLTDRGFEVITYDWSENLSWDASKPLPLLKHVGGAPLLAVIGRSKYSPRDYELLVKWLRTGWIYARALVLPNLDDAEREQAEKFIEIARPLVERLDNATGKMLLPALADGQAALVLDARSTSKQPHKDLPAADQPLPMPELALAFGVSDSQLLEKAVAEYRAVGEEALAKLREAIPPAEQIEIKLPQPARTVADHGTLWSLPLPADVGLDAQVSPSAGLGSTVLVLSSSPAQVQRMLSPQPLPTEALPGGADRPLAAAVLVNWPGIIEALAPWTEYGMKQARDQGNLPAILGVEANVRTLLEVAKSLRGIRSVTYQEGDALVSRTQIEIQDVP
jgi:hypothetical protein